MQSEGDMLNSPEFLQHLLDFQRITAAPYRLADISPLLEVLKESNILSFILNDANASAPIECLRRFVDRCPELSNDFTARFVSVAKITISMFQTSMNPSNQSFVARVNVDAVVPTMKFTRHSEQELARALMNDMDRNSVPIMAQPSVPTSVKVPMDESTIRSLINGQHQLQDANCEGFRRNNREFTKYLSSEVRDA